MCVQADRFLVKDYGVIEAFAVRGDGGSVQSGVSFRRVILGK